jgi:hypothetical protein
MDIGNFSKRTILTGAGWTRNWGGRLAAELWQDLIGTELSLEGEDMARRDKPRKGVGRLVPCKFAKFGCQMAVPVADMGLLESHQKDCNRNPEKTKTPTK